MQSLIPSTTIQSSRCLSRNFSKISQIRQYTNAKISYNQIYNKNIIRQQQQSQQQQIRSIVYVRGQRVQGLIRDPSEILSTDGVKYGKENDNLKPLKEYLNSLELSTKIELSDDILLQIITHKSFAHGSKPYNANISFLGEQILQLAATKYVISQSGNLNAIGSLAHRFMWSDKMLAAFAESKGVDEVFFCKKALPGGKIDKLYKPKSIYSTITSSIIGAIASKYGKTIAEEFIEKELIPAYKN
ncbi:hypothetical protein C6P40_000550 [Pichia californica]|uniref:RNase III domain-containing protein n=1 Tax=Pichia californica TaxID=460514 RepID=A0A9P6WKN7_9ASCO|nr:hypothetical protein C6P42_001124 [[Candida] californica]KAG0688767.1 hypothetical protein C6P40_000550 [[Candida] californica]